MGVAVEGLELPDLPCRILPGWSPDPRERSGLTHGLLTPGQGWGVSRHFKNVFKNVGPVSLASPREWPGPWADA